MYAAKIQMGWVNMVFEGMSATEIIRQLESYQDFGCLLDMGRMNEGKKGQKELDKLETFIRKYNNGSLEMRDIKELNVKLKFGDIICYGVAEGATEIEKLKSK